MRISYSYIIEMVEVVEIMRLFALIVGIDLWVWGTKWQYTFCAVGCIKYDKNWDQDWYENKDNLPDVDYILIFYLINNLNKTW